MNSKDLRIGNLIWYLNEESESVHTVDLEILDKIIYNEEYPDDPEDRFARFGFNYAPIPLTEEWLLSFGFSDNSYKDYHLQISKHSLLSISFRGNPVANLCENITLADHDLNVNMYISYKTCTTHYRAKS